MKQYGTTCVTTPCPSSANLTWLDGTAFTANSALYSMALDCAYCPCNLMYAGATPTTSIVADDLCTINTYSVMCEVPCNPGESYELY